MGDFSVVLVVLIVFAIIILTKTAQVVPQRTEAVVERLGKYSRTISAGFHILIPFLDRIEYKHGEIFRINGFKSNTVEVEE